MKKSNYLLASLLLSGILGGFAACTDTTPSESTQSSISESVRDSSDSIEESSVGSSEDSSEEETILAIPVAVLGEDYSVSWEAVDGATGYVVNVNGTETTVTELSYAALAQVGRHEIKVAATDGTKKSAYSNVVSYSVFGVTLTEGNYYALTGANTVYGGKNYSFTLAVNEHVQGTPTVKVNGEPVTGVEGVYTVENVSEDIVVTVEGLSKQTYAVTIPTGTGYTVNGANSVAYGDNYSFTVALDTAYNQSAITVKVNGEAVTVENGTYTVANVSSALEITVEGVALNTYEVTLSTGAGYTVSGAESVQHGENYSFTVTLSTGYENSAVVVKVNGEPVTGNSGTYTVESVSSTLNITVEGVTLNTYQVTFNGAEVAVQSVKYGSTATPPTTPTKLGYTFNGWYTNEGCTDSYDFTTPVTGNVELYGQWVSNFKADDQTTWFATETTLTSVDGGKKANFVTEGDGTAVGMAWINADVINYLVQKGNDQLVLSVVPEISSTNVEIQLDRTAYANNHTADPSIGERTGAAVYLVDITEDMKTNGYNFVFAAYKGTDFTVQLVDNAFNENDQSTWLISNADITATDNGTKLQFPTLSTVSAQIGVIVKPEAIAYLQEQGFVEMEFQAKHNHRALQVYEGVTEWESDLTQLSPFIVDITEETIANGQKMLFLPYGPADSSEFTAIITLNIKGAGFVSNDQSTWWTTSETVTSEDNGQKAGLTITDGSTYFAVMHLNAEAIKYMSDLGYTSLTLSFTNDVNLEINKDATGWNSGKTNVDRPGGEFTFAIEESYLTEGVDFCFTVYTQQGTDGTAHVTFEIKGVEPFSPDQSTWWTTTETVESVDDGAKAKITITGVGYPLQMPVKLSADAVAYMKEQGYTQITLTFSDATNTVEISKDTTAWAASNTHVESGQTISYTFDITDDYVANGVQFCFSMYLNRDGVTEGTGSITVQIIGTNA